MRARGPRLLVLPLLVAGCAALGPGPGHDLLARADAELAAQHYRGARDLYAEFLAAHSDDAAAARASGARGALDRLLDQQGELDQLRQAAEARDAELARLRRELARLQATEREVELRRLRHDLAERQGEVDRLRADITRLRADLERLRNIDLSSEKRR
jgi:septal ring factor EnvC (AmiA/AmiB activator)